MRVWVSSSESSSSYCWLRSLWPHISGGTSEEGSVVRRILVGTNEKRRPDLDVSWGARSGPWGVVVRVRGLILAWGRVSARWSGLQCQGSWSWRTVRGCWDIRPVREACRGGRSPSRSRRPRASGPRVAEPFAGRGRRRSPRPGRGGGAPDLHSFSVSARPGRVGRRRCGRAWR